jgi:hypothetical protein
MTDSSTLAVLTSGTVIPPIATHWSRILYYDLFTGRTDDSTADLSEFAEGYMPPTYDFRTLPSRGKNREIFVATKGSSGDTGSHRIGSRIKPTAVLLSIYIAMYLAVWGILRIEISSDATAAIAPDTSMAPSAAATLSTSQADLSESPSSDSFGQVSEPADSSSGCRPSAAIDSESRSD